VRDADPEEGPPERKYDSLPVDTALRKEGSAIGTILRNGKFSSSKEKDDFDNFYKNYFLSRWTVQEDIRNLPRYRQDLAGHFRTAKSGEVRADLTRLVLDFLTKLVGGKYHPAVKVNAMLMIGELNRVEQAGKEAAVPLPEALDVLIAAVKSTKLSEGLRATAMVGVLRHASAGIQGGDAQKKVSDAMLRLAGADLPTGSAPSGRAWIVAQAVETLGALGSVGENNDVFTAIVKLAADAKLPFLVRCSAADALGRLSYSSTSGIDPVETAVVLRQLAIDVCKEELRATKDTGTPVSRRRMLHRLGAVRTALDGDDEKTHKGIASLPAKDPAQQPFVAGLQKALKEAVDVLDDKKKERDDMKPTVTGLQKELEDLLPKKP